SAPSVLYSLSLHDALPICVALKQGAGCVEDLVVDDRSADRGLSAEVQLAAQRVDGRAVFRANREGAGRQASARARFHLGDGLVRSEEHTSELQSRENLVCR